MSHNIFLFNYRDIFISRKSGFRFIVRLWLIILSGSVSIPSSADDWAQAPSQFEFFLYPPSGNPPEGAEIGKFWYIKVKDDERSNLPDKLEIPAYYIGLDEYGDRDESGRYYNLPVYVIHDLAGCNFSYVSIPASIKQIGDNSFINCTNLKSVVIPNNVNEVGMRAFWECSSLKSVVVSPANNVHSSFSGCDIRKGAYPMKGTRAFVAEIEVPYPEDCVPDASGLIFNASKTAFYFAPWDISNLELPASVTTIGSKAFAGCTKLSKLIMRSEIPPTVSDDTFDESDIKYIEVPGGCRGAYISQPGWSGLASRIKEEEEVVMPEKVEIVTDLSAVTIGQSIQLQANVIPSNAKFKEVEWSVGDSGIAEITENGVLTAKAVATTEIITTIKNTTVRNVHTLVVHPVLVERITIESQKLFLPLGTVYTLGTSVFPENATDKTLEWSSTDESVATVDEYGKVSSHGLGVCTITVKPKDGAEVSNSCIVTVEPRVATSIAFDKTTWRGKVNSTFQITATILPENTTDKKLSWSSSNREVATVDQNGVVTTCGVGEANIIATTVNYMWALCKVVVEETPATKVTIDRAALGITGDNLELSVGETRTVTATVEPDNTTDKTLYYESSSPKNVKVDTNGRIRALLPGEAIITVRTKDGVSDQIQVSVMPVLAESIRISFPEMTFEVGDEIPFHAQVLPSDTSDKTVSWTSSDDGVAVVDESGLVRIISVGTAIITVTTSNGLTDKREITVSPTRVTRVTIDRVSLGITGDILELYVGETRTVTATVTPANATNKTLTYKSDSPEIVSVDENGNIKAISPGSATIVVSEAGGLGDLLSVTVVARMEESVTLNIMKTKLTIGQTVQLLANVLPTNATDKSVVWSSSDADVATVDENGLVTAVSIGTTVITTTSVNGLKAECEVTVAPTPVESVTLSHAAATLNSGETLQLTATLLPEGATDKSVAWSSSDAGVATVDEDGLITPVSVGTAVITATSANGLTAKCSVTVAPTIVESITLNHAEATLKSGEVLQLKATLFPEDATDKSVVWSSTNTGVATVDENGWVTAVSVGTSVITCTSVNGYTAECTIIVAPTPVESVTLNLSETTLKYGETLQLTATLRPENATDKSVTWSSSDAGVATVDENGLIAAVAVGKAVITVTTTNGLTAECEVTVTPTPVESVTLNHIETTLRSGETLQLTATLRPESATDRSLTWSSSDAGVATVDENGLVTAVSIGTAVIKVTTLLGISDECKIIVEATPVSKVVIDEQATGVASDGWLNMRIGETTSIIASVEPESATDNTLSYKSYRPEIVSVDMNGNLKALSAGTTTVFVEAGTNKVAYLFVRVSGIDVESISLNLEEVELKAGETVQLLTNVLPENATYKNPSWSTSNFEVATVDNAGLVTAHEVGQAVITAIVGGRTATCNVTVVETPVTSVVIDRAAMGVTGNDLIMNSWESKEMLITIKPENATHKYVSYETSDFDVAYVDQEGNICSRNTGFADITATSRSGLSDQIRIWVIKDNGDNFSFKINGINYNIDKISNTASVGDNQDYSGVNLIIPDHINFLYVDYPVTEIESKAFSGAKVSGELKLPDSLIAIGEDAFSECTGLTGDLIIPNSVTSLGRLAFYHCSGLNGELKISDRLEIIEDHTFCGCSGLTGDLRIPDSVSEIEYYAFGGCSGFTGILQIPNTVSSIGDSAFSGCSGLTGTLRIPDTLTEIEDYAFSGCSCLTGDLRIPDSVIKIGDYAFSRCNGFDGALVMGNSVTELGSGCFRDCSGFTGTLTIGEAVTEIGPYAFLGTCFNSIELPASLSSISSDAFDLTAAENMTVICRAVNPPVLNSHAFIAEPVPSATLYVPMMSIDSYKNRWSYWYETFKEIRAIEGVIPESVELNVTTPLTVLRIKQCVQLVATVHPDDSYDKSVTWTSSDAEVATVDDNGLVTAVSVGTAVITATTVNGLKAECWVAVSGIPVESITLNHAEATLESGETLQLTATLLPEDATMRWLDWSSSDKGVATVDENGLVTAVSPGTTVITATTDETFLKASCIITVIDSGHSGATDIYGDEKGGKLSIKYIPGGIVIEGTNSFDTAIDIFAENGILMRHYDVNGGELFREKVGKVTLPSGIYVVRAMSRNSYDSQKIQVN